MTINRRRFLLASASLPVLALIGCQRKGDALPKELIMQKYSMKTYAIGRFLIDLPENIQNISRAQKYNGLDIKWHSEIKNDSLEANIATKLARLEQTGQLLIKSKHSDVMAFVFFDQPDSKTYLSLEAYRFASNEGIYTLQSPIDSAEVADDAIKWAFSSLKKITIDENPLHLSTKGFVLEHGVIKETDPLMSEEAAIMATLNGILISFSTQVIDQIESTSLLDRSRNALAQFPEISKTIQVLRQQKKVVAGLDGEEDCYKNLPESKEPFSHSFEWQYQGQPNSLASPAIRMGFNVGGSAGKSTMSDSELLGLWEVIQDSIRLRPNSV